MRTIPVLLAAAMLIGCGTNNTPNVARGLAQKPVAVRDGNVVHPTLLIKFKQTMRAQELGAFRTRFQLRNVGQIAQLGIYIEQPTGDTPIDQVLDNLNAAPEVEYAELNGRIGVPE